MSLNFSSFVENFSHVMTNCLRTKTGFSSTTAFTVTIILLLLPLYIRVLHLGFHRWQQQGSRMTVSHADFFTYNMVVMEMMSISGSTLLCYGVYSNLSEVLLLGFYLVAVNLSGQMLFHVLTCVERYLAVVHPITYMSLRRARGIRIRNIITGCVWIMSFAVGGLIAVENQAFIVLTSFIMTGLPLISISFCSLSVAWVLFRPRPGEVPASRQRIDQSKLRAFYTIIAVLAVLFFRFGQNLMCNAFYASAQFGEVEKCHVRLSALWFALPSSLVSPLLFLQRAGKLLCFRSTDQSAKGSA